MFYREIRLCWLLGGRATPWPLATGIIDGKPFYTMVRMHGLDLRVILRRFQERRRLMQPDHAMTLIAHFAGALSQMHGGIMWHGTRVAIVHRDLSPDNMMVTHRGAARILDLGTALPVLPVLRKIKAFAVGKERYMAPEQRHDGVVDVRGDIFAFGRIMEDVLECCADTPHQLDRDLARIVKRCTADNMRGRWRSVHALLRAFLVVAHAHGVGLRLDAACAYFRKCIDFNSLTKPQCMLHEAGTRLLD